MKPHKHAAVIHAFADGAQVQVRNAGDARAAWVDTKYPDFADDQDYRVKPNAPVVETKMTDAEICYYLPMSAFKDVGFVRRAMNVALGRVIADGQVVPISEAKPGLRPHNPYTGALRDQRDIDSDPMGMAIHHPAEPMRAAQDRAARDMAVAKAVREAIRIRFGTFQSPCTDMELAAIIGKVPA